MIAVMFEVLPNAERREDYFRIASELRPLLDAIDGRLNPDYVINKGHYFGTDLSREEPGLSDPEKRALIAFLKTM